MGGAVDYVGDGVSVGGDDHGVEMPVVVGKMAEGPEWELTTTSECGEDGAFALGGELGFGAVEGADGGVDFLVSSARCLRG